MWNLLRFGQTKLEVHKIKLEAHKTKLEVHMIKFEVCTKVSIIVEFNIIYIYIYDKFVRLILNCLPTFI